MTIKRHTSHYLEHDGESFPLPFDPCDDPEHVYVSANGLKAIFAFAVRDDAPVDPFEEFEEGDFYQFDSSYKHDAERPSIEDFKRLARANPGRLVTVDRCGDGYRVGTLVTPAMCRNKRSHTSTAETLLEDADGYYIAPEDVTDALQYSRGALKSYSAWCEGDVYAVVVWQYTRTSIADEWGHPDRDRECWGYYGYDYALEELDREFKSCFDLNTIERGSK